MEYKAYDSPIDNALRETQMTKTHNTIENAEKLAKLIAAKHGIPMDDAMGLAEFNLNYSNSYAEAAARV